MNVLTHHWRLRAAQSLAVLLLGLTTLLAPSCSKGNDEPKPAPTPTKTAFSVSPTELTIEEGKTGSVSFVGATAQVTSSTDQHLKVSISSSGASIEALSFSESPITLVFTSGKETARLTVRITKKPKTPFSLAEPRLTNWLVGETKEINLIAAGAEVVATGPKHIEVKVQEGKITVRPLFHLAGEHVIILKSGSEEAKLTMTTQLPTASDMHEQGMSFFYGKAMAGIFDESGRMIFEARTTSTKYKPADGSLEYIVVAATANKMMIVHYPHELSGDKLEFKVRTKGLTLKAKDDSLLFPDGDNILSGTLIARYRIEPNGQAPSKALDLALIHFVLDEKNFYAITPVKPQG